MLKIQTRLVRRYIATIFFAIVISSQASANEKLDRLFGLGPLDAFTVQSETLGRDFHIYVRLPLDYEESSCEWPVVYLLDGGILFPMLAPYQLMLEIDELAPPVVMVGISYGGLSFSNGNYRSTDYTAPAEEPAFYGGAASYQDFLADELIPRINADYRVDQQKSLVLGQSLGGQFTLLTALSRPALFGNYLAINPALHNNVAYFKQLKPAERATATPILITRSTEERPRFSGPLQQWLGHWQSNGNESLALELQWLPNQHHASSAPIAYQKAIQWWSPSTCVEQ
ncbi:MAG: alpha/beta hydrolase-fold protein [Pseudomonadota bacterium]